MQRMITTMFTSFPMALYHRDGGDATGTPAGRIAGVGRKGVEGMDVYDYRKTLSGIRYSEWQKLRTVIDEEFGIKMSECKRQLALGLPEQTTEDLLRLV